MEVNKELYRRRQATVEHPFGIIKRQWDFYYIMTKKSIERASADVGIIFTAFNLRRIFNIIEKDLLKAYLKGLVLCIWFLRTCFRQLGRSVFYHSTYRRSEKASLKVAQKRLYLNCVRPIFMPI